MKRVLMMLLLCLCVLPVSATEFTAPEPPPEASEIMPIVSDSFGRDLLKIIWDAIARIRPEIADAIGCCLTVIATVLLCSLFKELPGTGKNTIRFVMTLSLTMAMLGQANTMIDLCTKTVQEMSEYGKLLLPIMTGALAAQGGTTSAAALYGGTAVFNTVLSTVIGILFVPLVYLFLVAAVANCATGESLLEKIRDFLKWLMTWGLKMILYVFTGYMSITGVITGTADAAAVRATKLTISGFVPVVGNILSDASEAVVLSAGVMKNAVGIYGLLAMTAIWISPFLKIGIQYLLLKLVTVLCGAFGLKEATMLVEDFTSALGILLGMSGTVCLLFLFSTICFIKGMG